MLPIHFAPLQGYTEDIYRRAHHAICGGVTCYYTPFIRVEHGAIRRKDTFDIHPQYNKDLPLALQIIASDATEATHLLDAIEEEWAQPLHIDLNLGCPFPLQVRHGRGAGLMRHTDQLKNILEVFASRPQHHYSVKMRLGVEHPDEWRDVITLLNDAPLQHVTLHPRVAAQQYGGTVDEESFAAFMSASQHKVIYNGDVTTLNQLLAIEARYPHLAGVMIGRGLLARPTLAIEYAEGREFTEREEIDILCRLHDICYENYSRRIPGEAQLLSKLRTFWDYAEPTLGRKPWKKIHKAGSLKNYLAAINAL